MIITLVSDEVLNCVTSFARLKAVCQYCVPANQCIYILRSYSTVLQSVPEQQYVLQYVYELQYVLHYVQELQYEHIMYEYDISYMTC
jgi:hypothetical protein